jgi:hypothetical protein
MNKRSLAGLILINAVLLASLVVASFSPAPAQAQLGGSGGEYLMISGAVTGRTAQAAVYIIELRSGRVAAIMFNGDNNEIEVIAGRNVSNDANRPTNTR